MLGIIVGDMIVSPALYGFLEILLPVALWFAVFGPIIYLIYWVVSRCYFVAAFCFNFVFGSFFTLDDVADKCLAVLNIPVDGFLYAASAGWDVVWHVLKFVFYVVTTY